MPPFPEVAPPPPRPGHYFVYILFCADGSYYIGQSNNVPERLRKHCYGLGSKHTADKHLARLIFTEGPYALQSAVAREAQLKRWSRSKKEALIAGRFTQLRTLAVSHDEGWLGFPCPLRALRAKEAAARQKGNIAYVER